MAECANCRAGQLMLAALEQACWDAGYRQIGLETHAGWTAAARFYERAGYGLRGRLTILQRFQSLPLPWRASFNRGRSIDNQIVRPGSANASTKNCRQELPNVDSRRRPRRRARTPARRAPAVGNRSSRRDRRATSIPGCRPESIALSTTRRPCGRNCG